MSRIEQLLVKLRLFDADNTLSLTNVTLIVLIVKLALIPSPDLPTLAGLITGLSAYNVKKVFAHAKQVQVDKVQGLGDLERQRLDKLEESTKQLQQAISLKKLQG